MLVLTSDLGQEPCKPHWNEADRLAALERYAILDTGREDAFDDVADLAGALPKKRVEYSGRLIQRFLNYRCIVTVT